MASPKPVADTNDSGTKEEQCVRFVDAEGRVCLFELHRSGTFNVYVDGRQRMVRVKKLYSEDLTLHLDGNKIMSSACKVKVPPGQDATVLRVMELYSQRRQGDAPARRGSFWDFLTVSIVGARGLRNADKYTKSDPYCKCEVRGKPGTKFKTRVIENNLDPVWNHVAEITDFKEGDTLVFRVFDKDWFTKDDSLGCATLKLDQTLLPSFEGDVTLEGEGAKGLNSTLKVRILAGTESDRAKHFARLKIEEALKIRTVAALSSAVAAAKECGLVKIDYEEAEDLLERLTTRMTAGERLWEAVHGQSKEALREALHAAQAAEIDKAEMERAKAEVRKRIAEAQQAGTIPALELAIGFAEVFKLDVAEYREAFAFLANEVAKRVAREQLLQACHDCTVDALRAAIQRAEEVHLHESEIRFAKEMLASGELELKKTLARRRLDKSCDEYESHGGLSAEKDEAWFAFQELREAMTAGEELGLSVEDLARAKALCRVEDQRLAMQELIGIMGKHEDLLRHCDFAIKKMKADGTPPPDELKDEMREARDELKAAIAVVRRLEVPENDQLKKAEQLRKKLHNILEDLKGSLRVICRVRPMSQKELQTATTDHEVLSRFDYMTVEVTQEVSANAVRSIRAPRGRPQAEKHQYHFDAVFQPGSQEEIFQDCADVVQSVLDGYNATIFAYGQTGAGKTHTMFGDRGNPGIGPRTIDELYTVMEKNASRLDYKLEASVMELYCDHLVDLLVKSGPASGGHKLAVADNTFSGYPAAKSPRDTRATDLLISHDERGAVVVNNLTSRPCPEREDLHRVLEVGSANREVGKTQKNDRSSRSHLVMIVRVKSVDKDRKERPVSGKLILCDLAGSERTKAFPSGYPLETQMTEANEINRSLTALADVITALVEKHPHVPYRNHKLTQILQDTLGGSAKALMFVNCSPAHSCLGETLSSLNWATCAKGITNTFNKTGPHAAQQSGGAQRNRSASPPRGGDEKTNDAKTNGRILNALREHMHPETVAA